MKLLITLFALLTAVNVGAHDTCCHGGYSFCKVKLDSVYDGDTFFVNLDRLRNKDIFNKHLGVRVARINTPEMRGGTVESKAKAKLAKDFTLKELSQAKRIDLINCTRGKFFRIICEVLYDGKNLSNELLAKGHAKEYK